VNLEVMAQLPSCNEDCVKQFMHLKIFCLGIMEDITDVVDWCLYSLDSP
jgi:hypothetical protein